MAINISISAADVAEVRHALRQLLGETPVELLAAEPQANSDAAERLLNAAREMRASLALAGDGVTDDSAALQARETAKPAPAQQKRRGRPPKAAQAVEPEPEAEDEIEQEVADEPEPMGLEAARETVRDALNGYVKMFGMDATQIDILKLYDIVFPDGSVTKVSDIPEGLHGKVVDGIREMAAKNPFKRKPV